MVMFVKKEGEISNKKYREMFWITDRTALRDLDIICKKDICQRIDAIGRETKYTITRQMS